MYEQQQSQSKTGTTDSPVLSSILIGSNNSSSGGIKTVHDLQVSSKTNTVVTGLSNSVPDESRIGFFSHSTDNSSGERVMLEIASPWGTCVY